MNPFTKLFKSAKNTWNKMTRFKQIGGYEPVFSNFQGDIYESDLVRSCIRPLANLTSKAKATSNRKDIERVLQNPNQWMTTSGFLYKVRVHYETRNTAFIVVMRDENEKVVGFYPMPYQTYEVLQQEIANEIFIFVKFTTAKGEYIFPWEDLVVIQKDYNQNDVAGDSNLAIINTLNMIETSNQSITNAVKSTANLRGILKTTKSMLKAEDKLAEKERFMEDYLSLENSGGVAVLDNTMEFQPVNLSPAITNWAQMKEFRENVFRYFGVNDDILMGNATPEKMQVFYEMQIEPFLIKLSQAMTAKTFTDREIGFGNEISFVTSQIQFMSMRDKLALKDYIDRGAMTPNTWCDIVGLPHVEGGDEPIRRLDTAPINQVAKSLKSKEPEESEEESEDE